MDGVERVMVLGIFAVIVAILGVAAWSVTQDGGADPAGATDGGVLVGAPRAVGSALVRPGGDSGSADPALAKEAHQRKVDEILGRAARQEAKDPAAPGRGAPLAGGPRPPAPTGGELAGKPLQGVALNGHTVSPTAGAEADAARGQVMVETAPEPGFAPVGVASPAVAERQPAQQPAASPTVRRHTVVQGETAFSIVRAHAFPLGVKESGVKALVTDLQRINPAVDVEFLRVGDVLTLPAIGAPTVAGAPATPAPAADGTDGKRWYTIQIGDSLSRIAERELGSSKRVAEILSLNPDTLPNADAIQAGIRILLPPS